MQSLFLHNPDQQIGPFSHVDRLKLIYFMLQAPKRQGLAIVLKIISYKINAFSKLFVLGGYGLEISKMLHQKLILAIFPLHNRTVLDILQKEITSFYSVPWTVPYYDIKEYFGEKIALYNVFIGHYSYWLLLPASVGFVFQMIVWGTLNFSSPVLPFFSLLITSWGMVRFKRLYLHIERVCVYNCDISCY